MRELTISEINKLASHKNVRKIAVENFLMTMGNNPLAASINMDMMQTCINGIMQQFRQLKTA